MKRSAENQGGTPQKKRKTSKYDDHPVGSIVRVKLHNFVTYDDAEFFPGPKLNVVIGPNGSGKSTIVCAFALGLAGQTSILGRAKDISEYIKRGESSGFVEIELKKSEIDTIVIRRDIKKKTSDWRIDGKPAKTKTVLDLCASLNVQIDNLCQFLPQDKVTAFAELNTQNLLMETERALTQTADPDKRDLSVVHKQLIEMRAKEKSMDQKFNEENQVLDELKVKNKRSERDVELFKQREEQLEKVNLLEQKRPWILFENQRKEAIRLKGEWDKAKAEVLNEEKKRQPLLEKSNLMAQEVEQYETESNKTIEKTRTLEKKRAEVVAKLQDWDHTREAHMDEIDRLLSRAEDREKTCNKLSQEIVEMAQKIEELKQSQITPDDIKELKTEQTEIRNDTGAIHTQMSDIKSQVAQYEAEVKSKQSRLAQLENLKKQKIGVLQRFNPESYKAYLWLEENRGRFTGEVYGPIWFEMDVPEKLHAHYLEQVIPRWLFEAYVCTNSQDNQLFLREVVDKQRIRVSSTAITGGVTAEDERDRLCDLGIIRKYGIVGWLDQVFDAPDYVKQALCDNASLHTVAAGSNETTKHTGTLTGDQSPLRLFCTPESLYSVSRSRYGNRNKSTRIVPLKEARLLGRQNQNLADRTQIEDEIANIKIQRKELIEQHTTLENQNKAADFRLREITSRLAEYNDQKKNSLLQLND